MAWSCWKETQWDRSNLPVFLSLCLYLSVSLSVWLCLSVSLSVLPELTSGRCHWSCPWRSWLTCADWVFQCDWTASWTGLRRSEPPEVFCPSHIAVEASPQPPWAGNASDTPQSRPELSAGQTCRDTNQSVLILLLHSKQLFTVEFVLLVDLLVEVFILVLLFLVALVDLNLRVDGTTDDLWPLASLPQSDSQVFGSVGLQQRHFGWTFLRKFLSGQSQVHCWTLSLRLEQLLKPLHIQILRETSS